MIKITLKNGFYYKGTILEEDGLFLKILDITGKVVHINKTEISVREESK